MTTPTTTDDPRTFNPTSTTDAGLRREIAATLRKLTPSASRRTALAQGSYHRTEETVIEHLAGALAEEYLYNTFNPLYHTVRSRTAEASDARHALCRAAEDLKRDAEARKPRGDAVRLVIHEAKAKAAAEALASLRVIIAEINRIIGEPLTPYDF